MKTAMQLMVWYLENEGLQESGVYYKAKMLLEKEKEQIMLAYNDGVNDGNTQGLLGKEGNGNYVTIENYYEETYNQNK